MHPDTLLTLLRNFDTAVHDPGTFAAYEEATLSEHPLYDLVRAADNLAEGVRTFLNLLGQRP